MSPPAGARPDVLGLVTAVMATLAIGAFWSLAIRHAPAVADWLALPAALAVAATLRLLSWRGRLAAAAAAALVALAAAYAFCIGAVIEVAALVGVPVREAFQRMDLDFAIAVASAGTGPGRLLLVASGMALAAWLCRRQSAPIP